jgi:hypothetical protein
VGLGLKMWSKAREVVLALLIIVLEVQNNDFAEVLQCK